MLPQHMVKNLKGVHLKRYRVYYWDISLIFVFFWHIILSCCIKFFGQNWSHKLFKYLEIITQKELMKKTMKLKCQYSPVTLLFFYYFLDVTRVTFSKEEIIILICSNYDVWKWVYVFIVLQHPFKQDGQGPNLNCCMSIQFNTLEEKSRYVLKGKGDERITQDQCTKCLIHYIGTIKVWNSKICSSGRCFKNTTRQWTNREESQLWIFLK